MRKIRRIMLLATMALVMAAMTVAMAMPAFAAAKEFSPNPNAEDSCGLGRPGAQEAVALEEGPGATEFARQPPSEAGCTGQK
jgi:hypothetical protein